MKMLLVYNQFEADRNSFLIDEFKRICKQKNIQFNLLIEEQFDESYYQFLKNELKPNFIIFRTINEKLRERLALIAPIFNNNKVSDIANDKWKAICLASSLGLPTPKTEYHKFGELLYTQMSFPCVAKPTDGKGGKNVFLVNNESELKSAISAIGKHNYLIQEPMNLGRDMRVYVIGKRVIAALLRKSDVDFRANFCLGGEAIIVQISSQVEKYVKQITVELDSDYIGIDFMFSRGQPVFNEIEDVVGSRMIYAKTDINPVSLYIEHILAKLS